MWTSHAERLVPDEPSAVRAAISALIGGLWGDRSRCILDDLHERIDAIATDAGVEDPDVWLTWRIRPHPEGTWVEVQLDELARGPDPRSELTNLLDTLAVQSVDPPIP